MKYLYIAILSFLFVSCNSMEHDIEQDLQIPNTVHDKQTISSFLWQVPIEESSILKRKKLSSLHPILYKDKVIFNNFELSGFVALDQESGEVEWDNRGSTNPNYVAFPPIVEDNKMYYVKTGGIREINLDNGNLEAGYLWPNTDEYLDIRINKIGDKIYAPLGEFKMNEKFSEWVSCDLDKISIQDWSHNFRITPAENNGLKRIFHKPQAYRNNAGQNLMIYSYVDADKDWKVHKDNMVAVNLDTGATAWELKEFVNYPLENEAALIEDNRMYVRSGREVFCINAENGEIIWMVDGFLVDDILSKGGGIKIKDNKLIVCGLQKHIFALDKMTGDLIWSLKSDNNRSDEFAQGSVYNTANIYKDKLYYISAWGSLMVVDINTGNYSRYHLPTREKLKEYSVSLFEHSFKDQSLIINEEGIAFTSDGYRFLAFEVPVD